MKLCLIGYHNLLDGFYGSVNSLKKKYSYEIDFFPLTTYLNMINEKETNINSVDDIIKIIIDIINNNTNYPHCITSSENKIDVILWWNINISVENLIKIRENTNVIHLFYSWDDPFATELYEDRTIFKYIDCCISCDYRSLKYYLDSGCKNVYYAYPGFDSEIHYPIDDSNYKCDISMVLTNLYNKDKYLNEKTINRKNFLDKIYEQKDINLHIYGPSFLKDLYPESYKGSVQFKDLSRVFYNSKINICTHVRRTGNMYINERVSIILGSGGLLYVDKSPGLDKLLSENECVIIDEENYINQIRFILDNYKDYEPIKINGYITGMKNFTWDRWASSLNYVIKNIVNNQKIDRTINKLCQKYLPYHDYLLSIKKYSFEEEITNKINKIFLQEKNVENNFKTISKKETKININQLFYILIRLIKSNNYSYIYFNELNDLVNRYNININEMISNQL